MSTTPPHRNPAEEEIVPAEEGEAASAAEGVEPAQLVDVIIRRQQNAAVEFTKGMLQTLTDWAKEVSSALADLANWTEDGSFRGADDCVMEIFGREYRLAQLRHSDDGNLIITAYAPQLPAETDVTAEETYSDLPSHREKEIQKVLREFEQEIIKKTGFHTTFSKAFEACRPILGTVTVYPYRREEVHRLRREHERQLKQRKAENIKYARRDRKPPKY